MAYLEDKHIEELTPEEARAKPWFAIDGNNNLRVSYDLNSDSLVYDVGGYEGEWTEAIYKLYGCRIEVYEPVREYIKNLEGKFAGNKKIHVHPFGLAGKTKDLEINLDMASSSVFKSGSRVEKVKILAGSEIISKSLQKINLMKVNIEGGEYALLENLIAKKLIGNIDNIQVQFHIFVPNARKKRHELQSKLSKTHVLTYCYPWIWENWRLKK